MIHNIIASSKVESQIEAIFEEMEGILRKSLMTVPDDQFTAWEKDYIEVRAQIKHAQASIFVRLLEDNGWDVGIDNMIYTLSNKKGKIVINRKNYHIAWLYIHCPLAQITKDAGRKVTPEELTSVLDEWSTMGRPFEFKKKNKFKVIEFKEAKEDDSEHGELKYLYLLQRWISLNQKHFAGKLKKPVLYFLKPTQRNLHGVWFPQLQQLGVHPGIYNADTRHFDELLVHEMCHQAVTEIDGIRTKGRGEESSHGPYWQSWMRHCGYEPKVKSGEEETIRIKGLQSKVEEDIKKYKFKEVHEAHPGDLVRLFDFKKKDWTIYKIIKFHGNSMHAISADDLKSWRLGGMESRKAFAVKPSEVKNLKLVEQAYEKYLKDLELHKALKKIGRRANDFKIKNGSDDDNF